MALLTLRSTSPRFSYVIAKNPGSGMLVKEVRRGMAYGWFPPDRSDTYVVWFRDSETEVSYPEIGQNDTFEYLDRSRYNSPLFVANAISDFLASAMKKPHEDDVPGFEHTATINLFYVPTRKYVEIFQQQFPDYGLSVEEVAPHNYRITVTTVRTIRELLNYLSVFSLFNAIKANLPVFTDDGLVTKYVACLNAIDAPYLVRYAFKANLLRSRAAFATHKPTLEVTARYKLNLTFGSTQDARQDFVLQHLDRDKSQILDVGCGEGKWARLLAGNINGPYVGVDPNESAREDAVALARRKMLDNVEVFPDLDAALERLPELSDKPTNVLLIEVLEHMPQEAAVALVQRIFRDVNVRKLIATTPNSSFSSHLGFEDGELRREDHVFEFDTLEAVSALAVGIPATHDAGVYAIGDKVDGASMGFGFVARRKEVGV